MKIKESFELRTVCGENVIVATGLENIDFSKIISLNESAAMLWRKLINKEFTIEDATKILMDEYEVDSETAKADIIRMVNEWKDLGIMDE